jgi:hypothetical protein
LEANGAVGELEPEVKPLNAGRETKISVPLDWYGPDRPEDPAVVRLVMEDHVISMTEGQFGSEALLRLPPQDSGWVQGYVDIDSRGLAADDRRYFSWNVRPAPAIAMIGDGGSFVTHALAALEGGGRVRVVDPPSAEVWISASGERLDEGLAGRRAVFVIPPTSPLDLPRLNRRLTRAGLPWQYETADVARGASRLVEDVAAAGLSGITIYRSYELASTGGVGEDSVVLRLETGGPWLVRGSTPEGSLYLLLATPLTPDASDLPVSAGMVPFFDAIIGGWAREGRSLKSNFEGGSTVRIPERATSLIDPDQSTAPIEGGALFAARSAGNHLVFTEDEVAVAFSVNAPVAESDLTFGERSTLSAALPDARWRWSSDEDVQAWAGEIFRARRGRLAWRPVVAMLILFAILEAILAAAGRRKGAVALKQAAERVTRQAAEAH